MPLLDTKNFGPIHYRNESAFYFPAGLPGFEKRHRFLPIQMKESEPIIFLQSMEEPGLCFITLPVLAVDPGYRLRISEDDLEELGFLPGSRPRVGGDVMCLAVIAAKAEGPTANLLAPIVVNLSSLRAVQAIAPASDYSWDHALLPVEAHACL